MADRCERSPHRRPEERDTRVLLIFPVTIFCVRAAHYVSRLRSDLRSAAATVAALKTFCCDLRLK